MLIHRSSGVCPQIPVLEFFQIVMLAYNVWRYMKMIAQRSISSDHMQTGGTGLRGICTNTVRIARLKLLYIAAKAVSAGNRDKVKYSIHDARTPAMLHFLTFFDKMRSGPKPWCKARGLAFSICDPITRKKLIYLRF
jgi:hypothetical protein